MIEPEIVVSDDELMRQPEFKQYVKPISRERPDFPPIDKTPPVTQFRKDVVNHMIHLRCDYHLEHQFLKILANLGLIVDTSETKFTARGKKFFFSELYKG